ncbi:DUF5659 domain-containing protein [Kurthia sp. Dielmo]|uniref:DUF5659 domain-containing protein n=1 Tax=Kurthia sp. Dielmo TaxID=1033738 RepID=UPI001120F7A7|nr:DUF5659 domain-containing protein [Kurthia sp. Dielmo]
MNKNDLQYPIFKLTLAQDLQRSGFRCIRVSKNKKNNDFNVYYFANTKALRAYLHQNKNYHPRKAAA